MTQIDFKGILGALICGIILFGLLSFYEQNKIAEIQAAGPEDEIVPPSAAVLFCVNHKMAMSFALACLILGLASYGAGSRATKSKREPPAVPPARI